MCGREISTDGWIYMRREKFCLENNGGILMDKVRRQLVCIYLSNSRMFWSKGVTWRLVGEILAF